MIHSMREIGKVVKANRKNYEIKRDEDGRAIAEMTVRDDSAFLSPYSTGEHEVIASDVAEFIEASLEPIPHKERIRYRIHSNSIDEAAQERYRKAIRNYYSDRYESSRVEKRKLYFLSLLLSIVGALALTALIVLKIFDRNEVLREIIYIFAWVFVCEAGDVLFLQCSLLRLKQKRYLALIGSVIEFYPLEEA